MPPIHHAFGLVATAFAADMNDPIARQEIFENANALLGVSASPALVDSVLLLNQQLETFGSQHRRQELELLSKSLGPLCDETAGFEKHLPKISQARQTQATVEVGDDSPASPPSEVLATAECESGPAVPLNSQASLDFSVDSFSLAALQRHLWLLPHLQKRRGCSWALSQLIYACDDRQLPQVHQQEYYVEHDQQLQQRCKDGAAEALVSSLIGAAVDTFVLALPEALELAGLIIPEGTLMILSLLLLLLSALARVGPTARLMVKLSDLSLICQVPVTQCLALRYLLQVPGKRG